MSILSEIVSTKAVRFPGECKCPTSTDERAALLESPLPRKRDGESFFNALIKESIGIIGEVKPKSPVRGPLLVPSRLDSLIQSYDDNCEAISVLTDEQYFGGSFELLSYVRERTTLPLLCKDFIIDERQIELAYRHGASAVLLIVKILEPDNLRRLVQVSQKLGLEPVVEINDETELGSFLATDARTVLINNRNLSTMKVDLQTTSRLAQLVPADRLVISASGISHRRDIELLSGSSSSFLIGEALVSSENPSMLIESLKGANLQSDAETRTIGVLSAS